MFLNDEIVLLTLSMTNQKLDAYVTAYPIMASNKYYQRISQEQMCPFWGLMIETGLLRISREPVDNLWL